MKIKWIEDQLVSTTVHAVVGTEIIGTITKSTLREEFSWTMCIFYPQLSETKLPSLEKAKNGLSKEWHGFLKRCGYRPPAPKYRPRRSRW